MVCTFTNTRLTPGTIELRKLWSGTAGNTTVSISQGDVVIPNGSAVADGQNATTEENLVDTGDYLVAETQDAPWDYDTSLMCFNDDGTGGGAPNDGIKHADEPVVPSTDGNVSVGLGDDVVCTFTNTRQRGEIRLLKRFVDAPEGASVNLLINGEVPRWRTSRVATKLSGFRSTPVIRPSASPRSKVTGRLLLRGCLQCG